MLRRPRTALVAVWSVLTYLLWWPWLSAQIDA